MATSMIGRRRRQTQSEPGDVELLELLGAGGFGNTYRARVGGTLGVVVKLRSSSGLQAHTKARLRRERNRMMAVGRLPGAVGVLELGESPKGRSYVVLEDVGDDSLLQRLRRGQRFRWRYVVECGVELARTLAEAHRLGLLHQDIKPDNILIDRSGRLRLTDFGLGGIACATSLGERAAAASLRYAAPEVVTANRVSEQADVAALAATLRVMLGRPRRRLLPRGNRPARPPRIRAPRKLLAVLDRATAQHPTDRQPSAAAFAAELAALVPNPPAETTVSGPASTRPGSARPTAPQRRRVLVAAAVLLAASVGGRAAGYHVEDLWPGDAIGVMTGPSGTTVGDGPPSAKPGD